MSLDELELILCDMYEMDEWLPNPVFDKNGFAKTSNTLWAIGEFRNYVANHIYPRTKTSIKNLEEMARSFTEKMEEFASMNRQNSSIFTVARTAVMVVTITPTEATTVKIVGDERYNCRPTLFEILAFCMKFSFRFILFHGIQ